MALMKRNRLSNKDIIYYENWFDENVLRIYKGLSVVEIAFKLNLKVEKTGKIDKGVISKLLPSLEDEYCGIIQVYRDKDILYEIMYYLYYIQKGSVLEEHITLEKPAYYEDLVIEYLYRAYYLPFEDFANYIYDYDYIRPKINELKFVHDIALKHGQSDDFVLKRIPEVRVLMGVRNE